MNELTAQGGEGKVRLPCMPAAVILLLTGLNACSLLDSKPAGHDATAGDHEAGAVAEQPSAGHMQTLESMVDQLIDRQRDHEARLEALEAIVLDGLSPAPAAGYPRQDTPADSPVTAELLASLPVEPEVLVRRPAASPRQPLLAGGGADPGQGTGPAGDRVAKAVAPAVPGGGPWVINLGSYASKQVADRMLAEFHQQAVEAELAAAVVNGVTRYRVRVEGFESRQAAMRRARTLEAQLGIADLWIVRR